MARKANKTKPALSAAAAAAASGYSGKSLIAKLDWRQGSKAIVIAAPATYVELTDRAAITPRKSVPTTAEFDFIHLFTPDMTSLARDLPKAEARLAPSGMIWVSWPKKTSALFRDLTEDGIRKVCLPIGLVDVKVCAVDSNWSGLKLYRRKALPHPTQLSRHRARIPKSRKL